MAAKNKMSQVVFPFFCYLNEVKVINRWKDFVMEIKEIKFREKYYLVRGFYETS